MYHRIDSSFFSQKMPYYLLTLLVYMALCKNTLQKRKDMLKIFKANLSFLSDFDVVYEKLDPRGVERQIACFSPQNIIYQGQSLKNYKVLVFMYSLAEIGLFKIAKVQNCTKGSFNKYVGQILPNLDHPSPWSV